jgi:hypothetical protein
MHWFLPFFTMTPVPKLGTSAMFVATVPVDDHHNMQWQMYRSSGGLQPPFGRQGAANVSLPNTTDWLGRFRSPVDPSTDFGLDREIQAKKPPILQGWTGLKDVNTQDEAMKWGQGYHNGNIVDRSIEHLGTTDAHIIRVRRRMLEAAKALRDEGTVPPGVDNAEAYKMRSGWVVLPNDVDWWEGSRGLREAFRKEVVAEATPAS